MANRLKMVQKQLLFSLFAQDWSNRKINRAIGIHRQTIARYRIEWKSKPKFINGLDSENLSHQLQVHNIQNVPPDENKCPPAQVAHFELPTDSPQKNQTSISIHINLDI